MEDDTEAVRGYLARLAARCEQVHWEGGDVVQLLTLDMADYGVTC